MFEDWKDAWREAVENFRTPVLELDDGQRLPVGRKYRDAVRSAFDLAG